MVLLDFARITMPSQNRIVKLFSSITSLHRDNQEPINISTVYKVIKNTECPTNPGPQENSVIWQNTEKCKEGNVVANHVATSP
jgi:hypothetical protein